jgi:hypothetical protein
MLYTHEFYRIQGKAALNQLSNKPRPYPLYLSVLIGLTRACMDAGSSEVSAEERKGTNTEAAPLGCLTSTSAGEYSAPSQWEEKGLHKYDVEMTKLTTSQL